MGSSPLLVVIGKGTNGRSKQVNGQAGCPSLRPQETLTSIDFGFAFPDFGKRTSCVIWEPQNQSRPQREDADEEPRDKRNFHDSLLLDGGFDYVP